MMMQILAGNARKVSAVRFERLNNESEMETKDVTRMFPKIVKRKWNSNEDSEDDAEYDGNTFAKRSQEHISNEFVVDQENSHRV